MFPRPAPSAPVLGDPHFASVASLLHFNGADAGTTFTDVAGLTWTASGNAQLDTAQKKFGQASLLCDGTGDYISCSNTTTHDFGSGDFTIEGWVRYNTVATPGSRWVSKWTTAGTLESWKIGYVFAGNLLRFSYTTDGTTDVNVDGAFTPVAGTWYHFAVSRNGTSLRMFINGTQVGSTADVTGVTLYTANTVTRIGRGDTGSDHDGWLDEIRITKGVGRYSAAFTAPSRPFPDSTSASTADDPMKVPVYVVSGSGQTKWVDYIPVKDGLTTVDGNVPVEELSDITGLTAWVDYIPVTEDAGAAAGQGRCESNGWIPVSGMNP